VPNPSTDKPHADIATLSFEKALAELETIVAKLERGDVPLEDSIAAYERGEALKAHCNTLLTAAEARVDKIRLASDGTIKGTEPLDPE
jgi:exodeoxyribonuclease VII small subunit